MLLIKNGEIYAPDYLGNKDLLIEGDRIALISDQVEMEFPGELTTLDAEGKRVFPGLVDAHVHIAGAGGEGGPETRTPEIELTTLTLSGITSVVGCLGTDGMTRNVESVLMKVKGLRSMGISAWMYTGAYQVPTPTLTGDVGRDVALVDEIIGVGEIALSDHRSSVPTTNELIRLAEHARVGGMLGGKSGLVNIHMGDARDPFRPIHDAVNQSELSYKQFYPTHCNRNSYIFEDAKTYGKSGWIDLTTSSYAYFPDDEIKPSAALKELLDSGVPIGHISMTSDAHGSLPKFDKDGQLVQLEMGDPMSMLTEVRDATKAGVTLSDALATVTRNPARILGLKSKGELIPGLDADVLIVQDDFSVDSLVAKGEVLVQNGIALVKGHYE